MFEKSHTDKMTVKVSMSELNYKFI